MQMWPLASPRSSRHRFGFYAALVLVAYLLISALGVTTSHTSIVFGSEEEQSQTLLGEPRPERSDEFLRGSPRTIASLRGIDATQYTPLDYTGSDEFLTAQDGFLQKVVHFSSPIHELVIGEIADVVPLRMGFALLWWLSTVTLLLAVPAWFLLLGLSGRVGVFCAVALILVPLNGWFSFLPTLLMANAIGGSVAVLLALRLMKTNRSLVLRLSAAAILGIYGGRMCFVVVQYPPWGFPILGVVALATGVFVFREIPEKRDLLAFTVVAVTAGIAVAVVLSYNRSLYSVVLDTVYPGKRRDSGGSGDHLVWSGALTWFLQSDFVRERALSNPERALGPTFLLIPTVFLLIIQRQLIGARKWVTGAVTLAVLWMGIMLVWAQAKWPDWMLKFNPLVWVPAPRAGQILGYMVVIPLFLILARKEISTVQRSLVNSGSIAVLAVGVSAGQLETMRINFLGGVDVSVVWWTFLMILIVSLALTQIRRTDFATLPLLGFLLFSSAAISPITVGLGAYGHSDALSAILELSSEKPEQRWATTGFYEDALMISSGVPQLSGQQPLGPNDAAWKVIDPDGAYVDSWNRGQSYVNFAWDGSGKWSIWNPSPDVIQVVIDPCDSRLRQLELGWVISRPQISFPCLTERKTVTWMGAPLFVYEVIE
jgi:hypothetical protein